MKFNIGDIVVYKATPARLLKSEILDIETCEESGELIYLIEFYDIGGYDTTYAEEKNIFEYDETIFRVK